MMDKKKNVFWLGMTSLFSDISSEMIMSILPLFLASLGISRAMIGFIEGFADATSSMLKVVSGWVSDRLETRKGIVVVGYTLSTIIKPLIALANTWYQVLAVRFLDRVGKGFRNPPRDALVADSVSANERGRAFGFQRGMDTFGAVIGTLLASALLFLFGKYTNLSVLEQYRTIFWLSVIPGIFTILIVSLLVYDIKAKDFEEKKEVFSWSGLDSGFRMFLFVSILFELSNFSYAIFILRASSLGVVIALIPIIYLLYNLVYAFLSQPFGILADRIGRKTVLFIGYTIASAMCFGFAFASSPVHAWFLFAVYGVVSAITNTAPRAMIADFISSRLRGTAYGVYYMLVGLVTLPASAIAGFVWDSFGAAPAFIYGGVLAGVAAALLLVFVPNHPKLTKPA